MKKRFSSKRFWLFTVLMVILVICLMPLFMMFFTAVIPQGDLFHLITEKTLIEFESSPIFLKTKMKAMGTRKFEVIDMDSEENKGVKVIAANSEKVYGVAAFTGDRDTNLVNHVSLLLKAPTGSTLYLGLKDINDNENKSEILTIENDELNRIVIPYEKDKFNDVEVEHVSQIQVLVRVPDGVENAEIIVDDIKTKLNFPTLSNFIDVWQEHNFARYIFNSGLVSVLVVIGNLIFCTMVAYAFARKKFRGKEFLFSLVLATMMIPPQVTIIPVFMLMKNFGWIDTYMALIVPALVSPFGVFLMRQYIEQLPHALDEAAYVDGANDFQIFTRIIMPLSRPAMAVLGINTFISIWNDLFYPLVMTNSQGMRTVQVGLAMFQKLNQTDWPRMMSASTIAGIPVIIIFLIFQKQIIAGLVEGGIKG